MMEFVFENIARLGGMPVWMVQSFAVVLFALVLELLFRLFLGRMGRIATRTEHLWDDALVYAGQRPISLLIWWQGLIMAARVIAPYSEVPIFDPAFLLVLQKLGLVVAATWFFLRLTSGFERAYISGRRQRGEQLDLTTVIALARVVRIAFIITGALTILSVLNIPISGLLAAGGVGGIAIGMAARDLLANFFGGFTIFMDRPFSVGDWVRSPDRNIEGIVEKIDWRITTIRKFDKRPIYVPNATFTTITLENPSRMSHRRISGHIGVRLRDFDQLRALLPELRQYVTDHDGIDDSQTTLVNFDRYGETSLDILIYCFTKTTNWVEYHKQREDLLLGIGEIIRAHGAEIARPARELELDLPEQMKASLQPQPDQKS